MPQTPATSAAAPLDRGPIRSRLWSVALIVLGLSALLLFARLGERSLWGQEGRWSEVAREMRLSGNYFWPTINGKVYFDKPLLTYWLMVGASHLTGDVSEVAARLPSAAAGLLGVALVMMVGGQLYDRRSAVVAGIILTTSYGYIFFSRLASADIETLAGVLGALAIYIYWANQPKSWWVVGLWIIMAVTSLTKGLLGFVLPLLVIGVDSLLQERWQGFKLGFLRGPLGQRMKWLIVHNQWFFTYKTLIGVGLAALIYFIPFVIAQATMDSGVGLQKVFLENVVRFFAPFDHKGPVYLYFYAVFFLMAPWSAFLPAALVHMHCKLQSKSDRFTLIYFWTIFVFFTLSSSRRDYYLLPILPAAAILVARLLSTRWAELSPSVRKLTIVGFLMASVPTVVAGLAVVLPAAIQPSFVRQFPELPNPTIFTIFWALMLVTFVYALLRLRTPRMIVSISVISYLIFFYVFVFAFPAAEAFRGEKTFAQQVRTELKDDFTSLAIYKIIPTDLVFYLSAEQPILSFSDEAALVRWVESNPECWVILRNRDLASFPLQGSVVFRSQTFRWDKPQQPEFDRVLLRIN